MHRAASLERADRRRVVGRAPIGDVVAVHRGHDDMREPHLVRRLRESQRLERIRRLVGLPRVDVAVAARSRTGVAQDLEGRRTAPPALADVRAASLLADRHELALAHEVFHLVVARVGARRAHFHPLGPARALCHRQRLLHRQVSLETRVLGARLEQGLSSRAVRRARARGHASAPAETVRSGRAAPLLARCRRRRWRRAR